MENLKFIGNAYKNKYGISVQFNINSLFNELKKAGFNKELLKKFFEEITKFDAKYFLKKNVVIQQEETKQYFFKLKIFESKDGKNYLVLDEFVPDSSKKTNTTNPAKDNPLEDEGYINLNDDKDFEF